MYFSIQPLVAVVLVITATGFRFNGPNKRITPNKIFLKPNIKSISTTATTTIRALSSAGNVFETTKGMPDRVRFGDFFKKTVGSGSDISFDQFISYEPVAQLLADQLIFREDVDDLWISAVGDAAGLNVDEAYEMLCMVNDLPDPEYLQYLDTEFKKLSGAQSSVSFMKFLGMDDVQDMMNKGIVTMEDVASIWRSVAGDLNKSVDRQLFGRLNAKLDDLVDSREESESATPRTVDGNEIDVWDKNFDPTTVFDKESLAEITDFFIVSAGGMDGKVTFRAISEWGDVKEMMSEGDLTMEVLQKAWKEAATSTSSAAQDSIDYDTFVRFNVRLDLLLDELEEAAKKSSEVGVADDLGEETETDESAESFYRSEFKKITGGGRLMRLDMLLDWKEIKELLDDGVVSEKQIGKMFEGMPKEPMGLPSTTVGISEDTFVAFNGMLDVLLDSTAPPTSPGQLSKAAAPTELVSEPSRPLPSVSELKMGSLGSEASTSDASSASTTGLSKEELDLMEVLDKADNMLNSGSFGDFDKLIGDMNDPRLQALREKREGAEEVRGQLNDVLSELLQLGRQQSRCGLDKPDDETAARIRDLVQAVIEKSPKAASQDISLIRKLVNGKWNLMYTNSEMFNFYNGVTGFANVFPTAKFQDLAVQYSSDGFLSEAKYLEKLTTAVGSVDATVYANWELVKEMSFMTNENSVVLRSYCTKVTAGPMEYAAEENWKSLRTMSMNELLYVDNNIMILRNCGALRIYFVYERIA